MADSQLPRADSDQAVEHPTTTRSRRTARPSSLLEGFENPDNVPEARPRRGRRPASVVSPLSTGAINPLQRGSIALPPPLKKAKLGGARRKVSGLTDFSRFPPAQPPSSSAIATLPTALQAVTDATAPASIGVSGEGSARLGEAERRKLAEHASNARRDKTLSSYNAQYKKFEWFCLHAHESIQAQAWHAAHFGTRLTEMSINLCEEAGPDVAARCIMWFGHGCAGYEEAHGGRPKPISYNLIKSLMSALQCHYEQCCSVYPGPSTRPIRLREYSQVHAAFAGFGGQGEKGTVDLHCYQDPQEGTVNDVYRYSEIEDMCCSLLEGQTLGDATGHANFTMGLHSLLRSDDARLFRLCYLGAPQVQEDIGPLTCLTLPILIQGAKKLSGRTRDYRMFGRDSNPVACPIGALARSIMFRYTLGKEEFPDPRNPVEWRSAMLLSGNVATSSLLYDQQLEIINRLYEQHQILVKAKTHGPRRAGSRLLESRGLSIDEIARIGGWNNEVVAKIYLAGFSGKMILAMGNWPGAASGDLNCYWAERFLMAMPDELLNFIFPFLPKFKAQLDEALEAGMSVKSAVSVYQALHWFAGVIFQDALELIPQSMARYGTAGPMNPCHQKLMTHETFVAKLHEYQALKASGALALFHRPVGVGDQIMALQQQLEQLQGLMVAFQKGGMDEASARAVAQEQAMAIRMFQAQPNAIEGSEATAAAAANTDEVMADLLSEQEGGAPPEDAAPTAATILSPAIGAFISPRQERAASQASPSDAFRVGPSSPQLLPNQPFLPSAIPADAAAQDINTDLGQPAILQQIKPAAPAVSLSVPPLAPKLSPRSLLQRFDAVPTQLAAGRPQAPIQNGGNSAAYAANAFMPSSSSMAMVPAAPSSLQAAAPVWSAPLAGSLSQGPPRANMYVLDGETLRQLLQMAASSGNGGALGNNLQNSNSFGAWSGLGAAKPSTVVHGASVATRSTNVAGERYLPLLSTFPTIVSLLQWLHRPPLGETGLSIIDREFRFQEHGLQKADQAWRGCGKTKQRFGEIRAVYNKIREKQDEMNKSGRRSVGGQWTDIEAAEKLDEMRVESGLTVAGWIKRVNALKAQPKKRKLAEESDEVDEFDQVGSAAGGAHS